MNKSTINLRALRACWVALACVTGSNCLHAGIACAIDGAELAFGMYDPSSNIPTEGTGTVNLTCTNVGPAAPGGASVALTISPFSNRKMLHNGSALYYGIYSNGTRTVNWGDGSSAPMLSTGAMQANETKRLRFTLYGSIPPLQKVAAGNYADALLITITP